MTFQIDQIALADIGHPRTMARAVQVQIRAQLGSVPYRFPLRALATQVGVIDIQKIASNSFDGILLVKGGEAVIGVRAGLRGGPARFTVAHELGHLLIPTHLAGRIKFECSRRDLRQSRPEKGRLSDSVDPATRKEIEANEFAAELLVPQAEYAAAIKEHNGEIGIQHIEGLARLFAVSKEMMARVYVERSERKVGVIISRNGVVDRLILQKGFPFLGLRRGAQMPPRSAALAAIRGPDLASRQPLERTDKFAWFDEDQPVLAAAEQTFLLRDGWSLTLLEAIPSHHNNDDDEMLRPSDRMFTGERRGRFAWDS